MSRMPIQVPTELKDKLEQMRDQYGLKTIYETIEKNIEIMDRQKQKIGELDREKQDEKKRREADDVYLGPEAKTALAKFQQSLGFHSPADAVEFLIEAFDCSPQVDRMAFDLYVSKIARKGG